MMRYSPASAMQEGLGKIAAIDTDARTLVPVTVLASSPESHALAEPVHTEPVPDPYLGALLKGTYRIERRLGAGGMGAVYLAEHVTIKKRVAVKILGQEYLHLPEVKRRFLREARAAAAIDDEHVIEIHDFGESSDGAVFFVMEYLQGQDLAQLLAHAAPLPWPRARDIMLQLCSALQAAHTLGIVHRDMKPANCFRVDRPEGDLIKVLDFGIAKVKDPDEGAGQALTRAGTIFGTPEYMAPEQARGAAHDHRVDIYAVGVILFQMLTGSTPFVADSFMGMLNQHMYTAPPRPGDVAPHAGIPAAAEAVVLKALQKDPDLRFQSMTEMAAALLAVDTGVMPVVIAETLQTLPPRGVATTFRGHTTAVEASPRPRAFGWLAAFLVAALGVTLVALWPREPAPVLAAPVTPEPALTPAATPAPLPALPPALPSALPPATPAAVPVAAPARMPLPLDDDGVRAQAEPRAAAKKARTKPKVSAPPAELKAETKAPPAKVDANTSPDLIKPFGD